MDTVKKNSFFVRKRMGEALIENGIIDRSQLETAIKTHQEEPASIRRRLSSVIIEDFEADRHEVMKTISRLYAFREVLPNGSPSKKMIENIRSMMNEIQDEVVDEMIYRKTVPFKADKDLIILASADPTDPQISILASELPYKLYELTYCKQETVDLIINKVYDQKNEFLRILDDIEFEEPEITEE